MLSYRDESSSGKRNTEVPSPFPDGTMIPRDDIETIAPVATPPVARKEDYFADKG